MNAPETRYVAVGEAEVAYQVIGEGPLDLVYHHGLCQLDLQWDVAPEAAFNSRLAAFSRLILFSIGGGAERQNAPLAPTSQHGRCGARILLPCLTRWGPSAQRSSPRPRPVPRRCSSPPRIRSESTHSSWATHRLDGPRQTTIRSGWRRPISRARGIRNG